MYTCFLRHTMYDNYILSRDLYLHLILFHLTKCTSVTFHLNTYYSDSTKRYPVTKRWYEFYSSFSDVWLVGVFVVAANKLISHNSSRVYALLWHLQCMSVHRQFFCWGCSGKCVWEIEHFGCMLHWNSVKVPNMLLKWHITSITTCQLQSAYNTRYI